MRERIRQTYTSLEIGLMQEENEQLKRRLEKAIEYIEIIDNRDSYIDISELRYIYIILQGEEII